MGATEVSEKLDRQKKGPSWIMKCADLPKERWRRTSQDSELWVEWRHGEVGEGSSWLQTEPLGGRGGSAFGWSGVLCPFSSGTGLSQPRPCHPYPTKHSSLGGVSNPSRVGGFLEAVLSSILFLCYPTPFLSLPAAITAPTPPSPFVVASRVTASILSGPSGSQI